MYESSGDEDEEYNTSWRPAMAAGDDEGVDLAATAKTQAKPTILRLNEPSTNIPITIMDDVAWNPFEGKISHPQLTARDDVQNAS